MRIRFFRILGIIGFGFIIATGVALVVAGISSSKEVIAAPMPETFFSSADPDTYVPAKTEFVVSPTGPLVAVPSLEMEAELMATGAKDGYLVLPDPPKATWYEKTAEIGANRGRTIIASHVDSGHGSAAPFSQLHKIEKGAPILVRDFDGKTHKYKATSIKVYERQAVPADLFRTTGKNELVLVTCSGPTINSGESAYYMYNLVVIAEPIN